jgi:ribosome-associated protein
MSEWEIAVQAAQSKKAEDIVILNIGEQSSFTNHFIICTATNSRQVQAIADSVETTLKSEGVRPIGVEGYSAAEWVLLDYGDWVFNVLSPESRRHYDLERLWRKAPRAPLPSRQNSPHGGESNFRAAPTSH